MVRRAEVSRGALLHHFPTHASLQATTVDELVRRNEAAVMTMTLEFLRGLALSSVLRSNPGRRRKLIDQWARAARILMEALA